MSFPRVCVYGAGAIGGWLLSKLALCESSSRFALSVVARGQTLAALRADGARTVDSTGIELPTARNFRASDSPQELGEQDLIFLTVKAPSMRSVAAAITPLLGPRTVVVPAVNGVPWFFFHRFGGPRFEGENGRLACVDNNGEISAAISPDKVVGCVVYCSCSQPQPGVARHNHGMKFIIGEPAGGESERAASVCDLLRSAGFEAPLSTFIQRDIWYKLWGNLSMNPVSAITGATTDVILGDALAREFVIKIMDEAKSVGAEIGITIDQSIEDRMALTARLGSFKTSMLQDVEAGRALEIDALVTAVVELGERTGVPTPFTRALLGLARLRGRSLGLY